MIVLRAGLYHTWRGTVTADRPNRSEPSLRTLFWWAMSMSENCHEVTPSDARGTPTALETNTAQVIGPSHSKIGGDGASGLTGLLLQKLDEMRMCFRSEGVSFGPKDVVGKRLAS